MRKWMYNSKATVLQECQRKYWFMHKKKLLPRHEPEYFSFGRVFHSMMEKYIKEGLVPATLFLHQQKEDYKDTLALMFNIIQPELERYTILSAEKVIGIDFEGWKWCIKNDLLVSDTLGIWCADYKTTAGYGASVAAYYHHSPQTLTYQYCQRKHNPDLVGTIFFILTKTKEPKLFVERVILTEQQLRIAELAMKDTIALAEHVESLGIYPRQHTRCYNHRGIKCEYLPICYYIEPDQDETSYTPYVLEVLNDLFIYEDPDDHLKLGGES